MARKKRTTQDVTPDSLKTPQDKAVSDDITERPPVISNPASEPGKTLEPGTAAAASVAGVKGTTTAEGVHPGPSSTAGIQCELCNAYFETREGYERHLQSNHPETVPEEVGKR